MFKQKSMHKFCVTYFRTVFRLTRIYVENVAGIICTQSAIFSGDGQYVRNLAVFFSREFSSKKQIGCCCIYRSEFSESRWLFLLSVSARGAQSSAHCALILSDTDTIPIHPSHHYRVCISDDRGKNDSPSYSA